MALGALGLTSCALLLLGTPAPLPLSPSSPAETLVHLDKLFQFYPSQSDYLRYFARLNSDPELQALVQEAVSRDPNLSRKVDQGSQNYDHIRGLWQRFQENKGGVQAFQFDDQIVRLVEKELTRVRDVAAPLTEQQASRQAISETMVRYGINPTSPVRTSNSEAAVLFYKRRAFTLMGADDQIAQKAPANVDKMAMRNLLTNLLKLNHKQTELLYREMLEGLFDAAGLRDFNGSERLREALADGKLLWTKPTSGTVKSASLTNLRSWLVSRFSKLVFPSWVRPTLGDSGPWIAVGDDIFSVAQLMDQYQRSPILMAKQEQRAWVQALSEIIQLQIKTRQLLMDLQKSLDLSVVKVGAFRQKVKDARHKMMLALYQNTLTSALRSDLNAPLLLSQKLEFAGLGRDFDYWSQKGHYFRYLQESHPLLKSWHYLQSMGAALATDGIPALKAFMYGMPLSLPVVLAIALNPPGSSRSSMAITDSSEEQSIGAILKAERQLRDPINDPSSSESKKVLESYFRFELLGNVEANAFSKKYLVMAPVNENPKSLEVVSYGQVRDQNVSEGWLRLTSLRPIVLGAGETMTLPTPENHEILGWDWQSIDQDEHYPMSGVRPKSPFSLRLHQSGGYLIVNSSSRPQTWGGFVDFAPVARVRPSVDLQLSHIKRASKDLGISVYLTHLDKISSSTITLDDFAVIKSNNSWYWSYSSVGNKIWSYFADSHTLDYYRQFALNGELYYQCDAANHLLGVMIEAALPNNLSSQVERYWPLEPAVGGGYQFGQEPHGKLHVYRADGGLEAVVDATPNRNMDRIYKRKLEELKKRPLPFPDSRPERKWSIADLQNAAKDNDDGQDPLAERRRQLEQLRSQMLRNNSFQNILRHSDLPPVSIYRLSALGLEASPPVSHLQRLEQLLHLSLPQRLDREASSFRYSWMGDVELLGLMRAVGQLALELGQETLIKQALELLDSETHLEVIIQAQELIDTGQIWPAINLLQRAVHGRNPAASAPTLTAQDWNTYLRDWRNFLNIPNFSRGSNDGHCLAMVGMQAALAFGVSWGDGRKEISATELSRRWQSLLEGNPVELPCAQFSGCSFGQDQVNGMKALLGELQQNPHKYWRDFSAEGKAISPSRLVQNLQSGRAEGIPWVTVYIELANSRHALIVTDVRYHQGDEVVFQVMDPNVFQRTIGMICKGEQCRIPQMPAYDKFHIQEPAWDPVLFYGRQFLARPL